MSNRDKILESFLALLSIPQLRELLDRAGYPGACVAVLAMLEVLRRKVSSPVAC